MDERYQQLINKLGADQIKINEPMSRHTTFRIGGPADLFMTVNDMDKFIPAIKLAGSLEIPLFILGNGSNILVKDRGIEGLVVQNRCNNISFKVNPGPVDLRYHKTVSRFSDRSLSEKNSDWLDYDETNYPTKVVVVDAGTKLQPFIRWCFQQGLTGLQWFAGIPATVAAALVNNIHGGSHFFSEFVCGADILDELAEPRFITATAMKLSYNKSMFRLNRRLVIVRVHLRLYQGNVERASQVYDYWRKRKQAHTGASAGCIFGNLSQYQQIKAKLPTGSIGYINDKILHLNGMTSGDAVLGKYHGNFITNNGKATAQDVIFLIDYVKKLYREKFGIRLKLEIDIVGK